MLPADQQPTLIRSVGAYAYDFRNKAQHAPGYWRDIGTIDAYYAASMDFLSRSIHHSIRILTTACLQPPRVTLPRCTHCTPAFIQTHGSRSPCSHPVSGLGQARRSTERFCC